MKRRTVTFRVTDKTRIALERAAARNGRSIAQEAEFRLDLTFCLERMARYAKDDHD